MGTDLTYSTAYHPQTDGQAERVNQIREDMLKSCALIYEKKMCYLLAIRRILLQ